MPTLYLRLCIACKVMLMLDACGDWCCLLT